MLSHRRRVLPRGLIRLFSLRLTMRACDFIFRFSLTISKIKRATPINNKMPTIYSTGWHNHSGWQGRKILKSTVYPPSN